MTSFSSLVLGREKFNIAALDGAVNNLQNVKKYDTPEIGEILDKVLSDGKRMCTELKKLESVMIEEFLFYRTNQT